MQKKHLATIFIVICTIILMCSVHTQASNYTLEIGQTMNVRVNQPNTSYPAVGGANYTYVWSITHYKAEGVDSLGLPKYVETRSNTVVKISSYSSTAMSNTITALAPGKARVSCKCTVTYNSMNPLYPMNSNIQTVPRSEQISVGTWDIIVNLNPTGVSIPTSISVNTNTSKTLTATLSPEGASSTLYWRSSNTSVATVNNGKVTGVYPGTATITVETKNGYKDTCTVTVTASSLKLSSTTPKSNATMVPIGETICFKYESSILEGWNSSYIGMFDNTSGQWVGISKRISGSYLYIIPTSPLVAEHSYTVTIPENAVVNTYGGGCVGGNSITFTTVDPNRAYKPVISLDKNIVTITAMNGEDIFYTLDGSNPATNGTLYNGPFKIELSQAIVTAVTAKNWKFGDSVTRVYDFAGYEVSHKSILGGSWDDQFLSVAPTSDGGYVASGNSYTTIAVHEGDWGKARCGSKKNGTIVKYNANGKIEWKALFGGEGNETFNSVATNGDGYVVVGYTANSYGTEGGLNEYLGLADADANAYYVEVPAGTTLYNRGFCDNTFKHSMNLKAGEGYDFSIWAKADAPATVKVALLDDNDNVISNEITVNVNGGWNKYDQMVLTSDKSVMGQLRLSFDGAMAIDMVSLMPQNVWGAKEEELSASAHKNFTGNPNYRLRSDLVKMLVDMTPTFLRFPGGCISEGSYIWDNVYDWKDSVGSVERRKENFNVWGYTMTLGLGYMEYFQLAEDLGAEPLPVMACGVLCQARSDYANPAGGELQKKYIKNFTDLIDFAINTDFDNNEWAALRKEMGHEAPFGLHYLGVGNENWGNEFFASFEAFEHAIDEHMKANYPGYELHIISTAGAQADDNAYKFGWKYLAGFMKGGARVAFTDGKTSFEEDVTWYQYKKDFLDTIVDEHYYRANDYLLENADRYNYYYRAKENGTPDEQRISKVFVGEYASNEKNTLAGAIAEAAVMTGFENNSDVVRLAATAPLFNKVVGDGQYRWTPDAIWFDNESVWRTPTYYVQQLFAQNIGTKLLATSYAHYEAGKKAELKPHGGIVVSAEDGEVLLKKLTVTSNTDGSVLFAQDFTKELNDRFKVIGDASRISVTADGCNIDAATAKTGLYIDADWSDYKIELSAVKLTDDAQLQVGAGLHGMESDVFSLDKASLTLYCVGDKRHGTGLKVYKDGKEGYTMGDYSSSVYAGNLRSCYDEAVPTGAEYVITVDFGGLDGKTLYCDYTDEAGIKHAVLDNKLEAYNREVFNSVTEDNDKVYIKLVNAEAFDKKLKLKLDKLNVKTDAKWIVLTADAEHVHTANVNTKEAELVVPVTRTAVVTDFYMELDLPANSVNIVVLNKI